MVFHFKKERRKVFNNGGMAAHISHLKSKAVQSEQTREAAWEKGQNTSDMVQWSWDGTGIVVVGDGSF